MAKQKWLVPYNRSKMNYEDVGYPPYALQHDVGFSGRKLYRAVEQRGNSFVLKGEQTPNRKHAIDDIKAMASGGQAYKSSPWGSSRNPKRPVNGFWPNRGEVDSAVNVRAQAMARTGRGFTKAGSDKAADALMRGLFGANAEVDGKTKTYIRSTLWNDYQSYDPGYRGYHLEGHVKRARAKRRKIEAGPTWTGGR